MKQRCENPNNKWFHRYGGRGIKICERWKDFAAFYEDMGAKPEGLSLDRIDNSGDYCAENCKWASVKEQIRNRDVTPRIEYQGRMLSVAEVAEMTGIKRKVLLSRIRKGWPMEEALSKKRFGRWGPTRGEIKT